MKISSNVKIAFAAGSAFWGTAALISGFAAVGLLGRTAHVFMQSPMLKSIPAAAMFGVGGTLIVPPIAYGTIKSIEHGRKKKEAEEKQPQAEAKPSPEPSYDPLVRPQTQADHLRGLGVTDETDKNPLFQSPDQPEARAPVFGDEADLSWMES